MPRPRRPFLAACETCNLMINAGATDPAEARAELEALKWFPMARKGGELEWRCPAHNPLLEPPGMGALTTPGPRLVEWTVESSERESRRR
jgi:hypothetical protein